MNEEEEDEEQFLVGLKFTSTQANGWQVKFDPAEQGYYDPINNSGDNAEDDS